MEKKSNKKKIMSFIKVAFVALVLYFLVSYFIRNIEDIKALDFKIDWGVFVVSMLFYFVYKVTLASLWHYLTWLNKSSIDYPQAITSYLYSILGKYIPGKVFMLAARIPGYQRKGVPIRKVTICFFIENICTVLGAAFLFLISLFFFPNDLLKDYMWLTIGLVVAFFICINPKIINFFLRILGKIIKKDDLEIPFSYKQMIGVVLLFIVNWLIVGTGFYMLVCSIYPLPVSQLLFAGGIYGLSAIIGILSVFAPSGIGVREGIMIAGLMIIMPNEYAVIISVISRLWQTVAELILILIAFIVSKIKGFSVKGKLKADAADAE